MTFGIKSAQFLGRRTERGESKGAGSSCKGANCVRRVAEDGRPGARATLKFSFCPSVTPDYARRCETSAFKTNSTSRGHVSLSPKAPIINPSGMAIRPPTSGRAWRRRPWGVPAGEAWRWRSRPLLHASAIDHGLRGFHGFSFLPSVSSESSAVHFSPVRRLLLQDSSLTTDCAVITDSISSHPCHPCHPRFNCRRVAPPRWPSGSRFDLGRRAGCQGVGRRALPGLTTAIAPGSSRGRLSAVPGVARPRPPSAPNWWRS